MAVNPPSLFSQMNNDGPAIYYDASFRTVIEYHLPIMRRSIYSHQLPIEDAVAYQYEGDFYGLLNTLKVPAHQQWIVMRLNGLNSPMDYTPDLTVILIPDSEYLTRLVTLQNTVQRIS